MGKKAIRSEYKRRIVANKMPCFQFFCFVLFYVVFFMAAKEEGFYTYKCDI